MADLVLTVTRRGGSGKTTMSHALGHGLGSLPKPISAAVISTDEDLAPVVPARTARRYASFDGTSGAKLSAILPKLLATENTVVIIDGAARRQSVDETLLEQATKAGLRTVVLVPFLPTKQDTVSLELYMRNFPQAFALPNRWPTGIAGWRAQTYLQWANATFGPGRVLSPFKLIPKITDIIDQSSYEEHGGSYVAPCRKLALEVIRSLGAHPLDYVRKSA